MNPPHGTPGHVCPLDEKFVLTFKGSELVALEEAIIAILEGPVRVAEEDMGSFLWMRNEIANALTTIQYLFMTVELEERRDELLKQEFEPTT